MLLLARTDARESFVAGIASARSRGIVCRAVARNESCVSTRERCTLHSKRAAPSADRR
jgi:hypothetical protein